MPLYDTALMLRGLPPHAARGGPEATDALFARMLKKEYALAEVYSPAVSEAHLRGDLHLCGLGEIDRFAGARLPLRVLAEGEWPAASGTSPSHFLARWRQASRLLGGYIQSSCAWAEVAAALAPCLRGLDDTAFARNLTTI